MANQADALSQSWFFHLRQIRSVRQSPTLEMTELLVHAFTNCRLDYRNSLLTGVNNQLLHRMKVVQKAGALFIKGVSWSLTSPLSTNKAISETKGQGWRAIPTQWRKASDILTSTMAAFLFSSHPKKGNDREAYLNYYASAYNRGRQLSHRKTRGTSTRHDSSAVWITLVTSPTENHDTTLLF